MQSRIIQNANAKQSIQRKPSKNNKKTKPVRFIARSIARSIAQSLERSVDRSIASPSIVL
jgi:hypothetical protein